MKNCFFLLLLLTSYLSVSGQYQETELPLDPKEYNRTISPFTLEDSIYMSILPELPIPEIYKGPNAPTLPYMVDNSLHPWFRPPYQQGGYSCGQASLVGYNFTYEINRKRELPGNIPENQYPTHFTWNFDNSANQYGGVSYFHSIEILRETGNPNCAVYGGMSAGGEYRWMSGYDNYYHAMQNRITTAYQLKVNTVEGLQHLKHWLHDHLEGSETGGLASFYANQPYWPLMRQLPAGTPEEGKYVTVSWVSSTHSLCIVGYNDSIRWDYNQDGQYTNHIDINNDGIVNMKDWEIGGLKFVNSYGGVPNWGDGGFCYMMYKTLADEYGDGGIWNNTVTMLDVKKELSPQLTMKVHLKHTSREYLKIISGMSTDIQAGEPEIILQSPIINYQGSTLYMQGGNTEDDKYLEFGLDVSEFLSYLQPGQQAKFFFSVIENDPNNYADGEIVSFSLMDYTDTLEEIPCQSANTPLINNDTTTLTIIHTPDFEKVNILNNSLPPAFAGEAYNYQLVADLGSAPYYWDIDFTFDDSSFTSAFPYITDTELNPENNDESHVMQALGFSFPFYGKIYDTVWVHTDGTLQLADDIFRWYYLVNDELLFPRNINISPFLSDLYIYQAAGDGIWYQGDQNKATFRWKASLNGQAYGSDLNFAVSLYPSGVIEMYYDLMQYPDDTEWWNGISRGNCEDFQYSDISGNDVVPQNHVIRFTPPDYPEEMEISEDGLFFGIPQENYSGIDIPFKVTDNNNISNTRTLTLSSFGIIIESEILSGDNNIIEAGESASVSVTLTNHEPRNLTNASMSISISDTNFTLTDSTEDIGFLGIGDSIILQDAFSFDVSSVVPNGTLVNIVTEINYEQWTHSGNIFDTAYAPSIELESIVVSDGSNGILDPGETSDLLISIVNEGILPFTDINLTLASPDQYITINDDTASIALLLPDSSAVAMFNVTASENTPVGHSAAFHLDLLTGTNYANQFDFELVVGRYIEDYESADFSLFPWGFEDDMDWQICDMYPFEGEYAARSAHITHNEESSMTIDLLVLDAGEISFQRKVSCEDDPNNDNYDYLAFYIDDVEQSRWDGETDWSMVSFSMDEGFHRLRWTYHKDSTVSGGWDASWVDVVTFPSSEIITNGLTYLPDTISFLLRPDDTGSDSLLISNPGLGDVSFEILLSDRDTLPPAYPAESILGSRLLCKPGHIVPGDVISWEFRAYNASTDDEWLKDIYIDFPDGITIDSMTNFSGGTGILYHDSVTGNGASIHWHGEDQNGWGVVKGGEMAIARVFAVADPGLQDDPTITFELHGDIYGSEPHVITGINQVINLGNTPWLTLDPTTGTAGPDEEEFVNINCNTSGMTDSVYYAYLICSDNFNNTNTITVKLTVDTELKLVKNEDPGIMLCRLMPNPFSENLRIILECRKDIPVKLGVYDLMGNEIKSIMDGITLREGRHTIVWDGTTNAGDRAPRGIYCLLIQSREQQVSRKIILF